MEVGTGAILVLLEILLHPHHLELNSLVVQMQLLIELLRFLQLLFLLLQAGAQLLEEVRVL